MSHPPATFYLIRHASNDWLNRGLAGRLPGVALNQAGQREAAALADRLAGLEVAAIYSSPLERARQTAGPLAERLNRPVLDCPEAQEIDFGEWTGLDFQELRARPDWAAWNSFRSGARPPGGETMLAAQSRIVELLQRLERQHAGRVVVIVSHGDIIKAALAYYLGMPLDLLLRLEVSPASVNVLQLGPSGPKLLKMNDTGPA